MSSPSLSTKFITLTLPDQSSMRAYIAKPTGPAPHKAIILFQEAFGLNPFICSVADRFAHEGFMVISPELFHRTAPPGFTCDYGDSAAYVPHYSAITTEGIQADAQTAFDELTSQGIPKEQISCVGFCLGGRASFIANNVLPLKAAISFYGGGIANILDLTPNLYAPMLFLWGGKDGHIDTTQTRAIEDAMKIHEKPYASVIFGEADHAFFRDVWKTYHPTSAAMAWPMVLEFLK